jgi:hypothetical protein
VRALAPREVLDGDHDRGRGRDRCELGSAIRLDGYDARRGSP